ncbi:LPS export ABC transporter periplasmic protein LptC [Alteromonas sp. LMIT006]|uniref:LPS export ABC transporter periplasmic protein LptC n=1 Tax=Alteromonadaceae TaxID=72275 RepID=UPI0020CA6153|nr:LPS export ABC transporter periplasmic protein LptC [Alteromonas sp. LMIT006]UTP72827.1 LPS export ABC transporter periplasmic protein LptC [Alteromonas sp. LMIT006]
MNRVGFSIFVLFILVIIVYNLPISVNSNKQQTNENQPSLLTPTYLAEELFSQRFNEAGLISHEINAKRMEHYAELGFMVFTQPRYTIFLADGSQYIISAQEGTLYDDNRMLLENNIVIQSQNETDFIQQISAEYIEMNLDTKALSSNSAIVLRGKEFSMHSNGLDANLAQKRFALLEHTHTEFKPTQ